jgi:hypothetical protein
MHPIMCILEDRPVLQEAYLSLTGLHTWMRSTHRARPAAYAVVVLVCVALLVLLTFMQVAHVHSVNTDADHCPLCVALHTAAPLAVAAAIIVLVEMAAFLAQVEVRPIHAQWQPQLFIRPPPAL